MKTVKCIANDGAPRMLTVGQLYKVAVEVLAGTDHKNRECAGYILAGRAGEENGIARVWDFRRFEVVTEEQLAEMERAAQAEREAAIARAREDALAAQARQAARAGAGDAESEDNEDMPL